MIEFLDAELNSWRGMESKTWNEIHDMEWKPRSGMQSGM